MSEMPNELTPQDMDNLLEAGLSPEDEEYIKAQEQNRRSIQDVIDTDEYNNLPKDLEFEQMIKDGKYEEVKAYVFGVKDPRAKRAFLARLGEVLEAMEMPEEAHEVFQELEKTRDN